MGNFWMQQKKVKSLKNKEKGRLNEYKRDYKRF